MTFAQALLWPFSLLYNVGARLRAASYRAGILRQQHLKGVVISVGNLTVGGTGKTPFVVWLAERCAQTGKMTAVLCRGYRPLPRRSRDSNAPELAEGWNDETLLLRSRLDKRVRFGVGASRFDRGRELERAGVECFILDDGFQHLQLVRDVDIVLVDATNPFGGGHLLPAGRLREPISALRRADIVVITRSEHAPTTEALIQRYTSAPIYYVRTELLGIEPYRERLDPEHSDTSTGKRFFAFCGIGNPPAFFDDLKKWGIHLAGQETFRDHHLYTERDVSELESRASAAGADALLCTEKDIYDLTPLRTDRFPVFFCKIALRFNNEEALWQTILEKIERKRTGPLR
ncbi:MAG: tetraacyldisaccharide 4'-kinase [Candidatus Acidiferrales bacterium]